MCLIIEYILNGTNGILDTCHFVSDFVAFYQCFIFVVSLNVCTLQSNIGGVLFFCCLCVHQSISLLYDQECTCLYVHVYICTS